MLTESRDCSIEPSGLEPFDPSESDPRKIVVWIQLERSLIFRLRCAPVPVKGLVQEGEREMCDSKIRIDLQGVLPVLPGLWVALRDRDPTAFRLEIVRRRKFCQCERVIRIERNCLLIKVHRLLCVHFGPAAKEKISL